MFTALSGPFKVVLCSSPLVQIVRLLAQFQVMLHSSRLDNFELSCVDLCARVRFFAAPPAHYLENALVEKESL